MNFKVLIKTTKERRNFNSSSKSESDPNINIDFEYQLLIPVYAFEFFVDILFLPIILLTALLRPWNFLYCFKIIDENYNFKRSVIFLRLYKAILFYLIIAVLILLFPLYMHRLRYIYDYWNTVELSEE
jgi:hypothetical protein